MLADQAIRAGDAGIVVAGGMESMTRAPYLLTKAREGYRLGHGELLDAMILDGLWDVYGQKHMGTCGDACALKYEFSRREQDDFAVRSHTRARQAIADGVFRRRDRAGRGHSERENDGRSRRTKGRRSSTRPSSGPSSRRSARRGRSRPATPRASATGRRPCWLRRAASANARKLQPVAEIVGAATFSQQPEWFTTAPVEAIRKLLDKVGWTVEQVDLFEINEAFAVVTMFAERELRIPAAQGQHLRRRRMRSGTRSVRAGRGSWSRSCMH